MWILVTVATLLLACTAIVTKLFPLIVTRLVLRIAYRLLGLESRQAYVAGFRMVHLDSGGSNPPLILLHGLGADKDVFLPIARHLTSHFRLVVPDLPGFGESDQPYDADYQLTEQVKRLHEFVTSLGFNQFHLGGNSMGGMIAAAYAAKHPEQLTSLWLLAPAGVKSATPSELVISIESGKAAPILARTPKELQAVLSFVTHRKPYIPDFMVRAMAAQQKNSYGLNSRIVTTLFSGPGLEELLSTHPKVPTLIVWGKSDRAVDPSGAVILQKLLPASELILMPDIGHVPQIESPAKVAADYLNFVTHVEPRVMHS